MALPLPQQVGMAEAVEVSAPLLLVWAWGWDSIQRTGDILATAGNAVSLTTSPSTLFSGTSAEGGACSTIYVSNRSASSGNALVNVPGLHVAGDYAGIAPGLTVYFRLGANVLSSVTAKSDGTSTIDWGICAKV